MRLGIVSFQLRFPSGKWTRCFSCVSSGESPPRLRSLRLFSQKRSGSWRKQQHLGLSFDKRGQFWCGFFLPHRFSNDRGKMLVSSAIWKTRKPNKDLLVLPYGQCRESIQVIFSNKGSQH